MKPELVTHEAELGSSEKEVSSSGKGSYEAERLNVDEKKLIRKIDLKVLPILFLIYIAAFLDRYVFNLSTPKREPMRLQDGRVNISNALTMNLPSDLHLAGVQQNVALTIFFVPYVLFEVPSNILLKYFKPHIWRMKNSVLCGELPADNP